MTIYKEAIGIVSIIVFAMSLIGALMLSCYHLLGKVVEYIISN